eukprot:Clim_evm64s232 gene=Clim_evmTU64s232
MPKFHQLFLGICRVDIGPTGMLDCYVGFRSDIGERPVTGDNTAATEMAGDEVADPAQGEGNNSETPALVGEDGAQDAADPVERDENNSDEGPAADDDATTVTGIPIKDPRATRVHENYDIDLDDEDDASSKSVETKYTTCCHKVRCLPSTAIIKAVKTAATAISIAHLGIGDKEAQALAQMISEMNELTELQSEENLIGAKGGNAIVHVLKASTTLKTVNLSGNALGYDALVGPADVLGMNATLEKLQIRNVGISLLHADKICMDLRSNFRLTLLDVSENAFGEKGGMLLGQALPFNDGLKVLSVKNCQIDDNPEFFELYISRNRLNDAALARLMNSIRDSNSLQRVSVAYNQYSTPAIMPLLHAIQDAAGLKEIDISGSVLGKRQSKCFVTKSAWIAFNTIVE